MGTTYYVTRTVQLFGSYICSKCGSVILSHFTMKAVGTSTWSQAKASEIASEGSEKYLQALQNFNEKPFLVTKDTSVRPSFTSLLEVSLENAADKCPCCGNIEIWQRDYSYAAACRMDPETGVSLVTDVPEQSRMKVFASLDTAKDFCGKLMALKTLEARKHWLEHPQEAADARMRISNLKNNLTNLESRKSAAREKSSHKLQLVEKKKDEMKACSLFSAERKAAKEELKELKKAYDLQLSEDISQEENINKEIKFVKNRLQELQFANPGVMDDVDVFNGDGTHLHDAYRIC